MQTPKPPRWSDEEAVAKFVAEVIAKRQLENDREALDDSDTLRWTLFDLPEDLLDTQLEGRVARGQVDMVSAALRGNLKPLAEYILPINPKYDRGGILTTNKMLSHDTRILIYEFLIGKRNIRTGRLAGQPGRPQMSAEARLAKNPVHRAADEFPLIKRILRDFYPKADAKAINARAESIAQERAGTTSSISNYRRRSSKSGHKI